MSGKSSGRAVGEMRENAQVVVTSPSISDGAEIWRIARDSGKLDLNSSYAYLLWCRDFAETSAVARVGDQVVGFVIGYVRPDAPNTVVVWQIAVDASQRGRGIAGSLLDGLVGRMSERGVTHLETTITPDNESSIGLFGSLASRRGAAMERSSLFHSSQFPDEHESEDLYRIGPFATSHDHVPAG
jgi:L-2,4-diaminobutyric acid acetyltransferase